MSAIRTVRGPRDDLTGVARPQEARGLTVVGPGIRSLDGLERFAGLQVLHLLRVEVSDLGRVRALPALTELRLDEPEGAVDWAAVAQLDGLRVLVVDVADRAHAEALGATELGRLWRLERLELRLAGDGPPVALRPGLVRDGSPLLAVEASNFILAADDLRRLCALGSQLEMVHYTPSPDPSAPDLREALPASVDVVALSPGPPAGLGAVVEQRGADGTARYGLALPLGDVWPSGTALDLEDRAREALRAHDPALESAVDVEAGGEIVFFSAADAATLDRVRDALAADQTGA